MKLLVTLIPFLILFSTINAQRNILQELVYQNRTALISIISAAGLNATLSTAPATVFAPQESALSPQFVAQITSNLALSQQFLGNHAVGLTYNLVNDVVLSTLSGSRIRTNVYESVSTVNGIRIISAVNATNGVIFTIESVIVPPTNSTLISVGQTQFSNLILLAGITKLNGTSGPITILAPSDASILALSPVFINSLSLPSNRDILTLILQYHIISGTYYPAAFNPTLTLNTLAGQNITLTVNGNTLSVVGTQAFASLPAISGTDGVGYVINSTLVPKMNLDFAVRLFGLSTFYDALASQGLDGALQFPSIVGAPDGLTIFGPTNNAFLTVTPAQNATIQNALSDVLYYHAVNSILPQSSWVNDQIFPTLFGQTFIRVNKYSKPSGTVYTANGVVITDTFKATTGYLNIVDKVLFPFTSTINSTLYTDPRLTTLLAAVLAANVLPSLAAYNSTVTVFAPTNEAFAALPNGTINFNNPTQLFGILAYHVAFGTVYSAGLYDGQALGMVTGNLSVSITNNNIRVGGANIIQADLGQFDGVIHIIDKVLFPPIVPSSSARPSTASTNPSSSSLPSSQATGSQTGTSETNEQSTATVISQSIIVSILVVLSLL